MFKIVNRYGESVTVRMSMKEKTVFNSEVFVNNFDVVACKPYKVERV